MPDQYFIDRQRLIDRVRGSIDGLPGFVRKQTTIKQVVPFVDTVSTYVVETCRTEEGWHGFVDSITPDGTVRLYLPTKVMEALYTHHEAILKRARSERAQRAASTRRERGIIPFQRREAGDGA